MNGDTPVNVFGVLAFPNEADGGLVRFIDSDYNTLFHVPDGENIILTTFGDDRRILPCRYIDATHARIGGETFHICQFAEIQERNGAVYAPEHPKEGDVCDTYTIYQIKDIRAAPYAFMPYAQAKVKLRMSHYQRVYRGTLASKVTLDDLYLKHNQDNRPFARQIRSFHISRSGVRPDVVFSLYVVQWWLESHYTHVLRSYTSFSACHWHPH